MAQDAPSPGGLLSKVAKFVRNPTVNWSDLDHVDERESQYSKHQLKEMIERKRANDFVRKREFEQLRKLRQRPSEMGALAPATPEDSGFFDSSQPAAVGQREGTLKKIDEIEAQMAQHQWQRPPPPIDAASAPQFAPTVDAHAAPDEPRVTDFAATDIQPREPSVFSMAPDDMLPGVDLSFGTPGAETDPVSDPGLEEAAIRFANGDDAGCETALLGLVGAGALVSEAVQQRAWAALFDLYRATQQQGRFDAMAGDFVQRYLQPAPRWVPFAEPAVGNAGPALAWAAPAQLDAGQVTALAVQLAQQHGGSVRLDWRALSTIVPEALAPLCDLLDMLAGRPLRLVCDGAAALEQLLRQHTVSGQRAQPAAWWRLRLAWLRLAQRADEFDLVALDYCITYEVAPPSWDDARCTFVAGEVLADPAAPAALGRLVGVVAGDAGEALAPIGAPLHAGAPVVVDCTELVRIDFPAAGSVLNWAAAQQAAGRQVEFHGLQWLVVLFFHVIGVADHAKIRPRER
jgi:hypothetical protein